MSSLGPAEESHSDLPPAQLHCSLWQMAGFVPASCSVPVPGALPGGAGPQGSALGLCFLGIFIFSNGLQLQAERACVGALPASAHGLWCRLCMPFLYFIQQRGVTAELPGLLQNFLPGLWDPAFAFCLPPVWHQHYCESWSMGLHFAKALEKFLTTWLWITSRNGNVHFTVGLFKWNSAGVPHFSKLAPCVASFKELQGENSQAADGELPTPFHCPREDSQKPCAQLLNLPLSCL